MPMYTYAYGCMVSFRVISAGIFAQGVQAVNFFNLQGDWVYGKRHGYGVYYYADGSKYDGEWVDDKVHSRGTCFYTSGNKYVGEWNCGKINGV